MTPKGGAMMVRPGASRILMSWGLTSAMEEIADIVPSTLLRDLRTGRVITRALAVASSDYPDWGTNRQMLQSMLYGQVRRAGIDVVFNTRVEVLEDDAESASVRLPNNEIIVADLVLAADGIRSRARSKILSDLTTPIDPIISETTAYLTRLPLDEVCDDDDTKTLGDAVNLNLWMGEKAYVMCRASERTRLWWGSYGIQEGETDQEGLWDEDGDIEHVRRCLAGCDPRLLAALDKTESCDRWKLTELRDLPRWTSKHGRVILLGDSAHGMMPSAAQGFSQIVEDIGVLDYLLSTPLRTDLPSLTSTWEAIRKPRVEQIKAFARWNADKFQGGSTPAGQAKFNQKHSPDDKDLGGEKTLKTVSPDSSVKFSSAPFLKWVLDHDAIGEAKRFLEQKQAKL